MYKVKSKVTAQMPDILRKNSSQALGLDLLTLAILPEHCLFKSLLKAIKILLCSESVKLQNVKLLPANLEPEDVDKLLATLFLYRQFIIIILSVDVVVLSLVPL